MPHCLQRKYIDIVYKIATKWVNWDPPKEIKVGTYGTVDRQTGDLVVEGNIYSAEFQEELAKHDVRIRLADHPAQEAAEEDDFIITSSGAKRTDLNTDNKVGVEGIAHASLKGEWSIESGKREVILIMHRPRLTFLPPNVVLEHLYKVDKLMDKWLVTSIQTCPAYSMYLSDKKGDKVSLALVAEAPIGAAAGVSARAGGGFIWHGDSQSGLLRKACHKAGEYLFTPLFSLQRPIHQSLIRRYFRDGEEEELTGDKLWYPACPPWEPLDEEGVEDAVALTGSAEPPSDPLIAALRNAGHNP